MGEIRKTRQKDVIEEEIGGISSFFSADELHDRVKKRDPSIGIATIYRFLRNAVNKKRLYSYICDRRSVYSKSKENHCHFVCENTGKIIHFEIDNIDFLKDKIPGRITSFQLEVKGVCEDCCEDED